MLNRLDEKIREKEQRGKKIFRGEKGKYTRTILLYERKEKALKAPEEGSRMREEVETHYGS